MFTILLGLGLQMMCNSVLTAIKADGPPPPPPPPSIGASILKPPPPPLNTKNDKAADNTTGNPSTGDEAPERKALLDTIRNPKNRTLKKVDTVDRSAPDTAGTSKPNEKSQQKDQAGEKETAKGGPKPPANLIEQLRAAQQRKKSTATTSSNPASSSSATGSGAVMPTLKTTANTTNKKPGDKPVETEAQRKQREIREKRASGSGSTASQPTAPVPDEPEDQQPAIQVTLKKADGPKPAASSSAAPATVVAVKLRSASTAEAPQQETKQEQKKIDQPSPFTGQLRKTGRLNAAHKTDESQETELVTIFKKLRAREATTVASPKSAPAPMPAVIQPESTEPIDLGAKNVLSDPALPVMTVMTAPKSKPLPPIPASAPAPAKPEADAAPDPAEPALSVAEVMTEEPAKTEAAPDKPAPEKEEAKQAEPQQPEDTEITLLLNNFKGIAALITDLKTHLVTLAGEENATTDDATGIMASPPAEDQPKAQPDPTMAPPPPLAAPLSVINTYLNTISDKFDAATLSALRNAAVSFVQNHRSVFPPPPPPPLRPTKAPQPPPASSSASSAAASTGTGGIKTAPQHQPASSSATQNDESRTNLLAQLRNPQKMKNRAEEILKKLAANKKILETLNNQLSKIIKEDDRLSKTKEINDLKDKNSKLQLDFEAQLKTSKDNLERMESELKDVANRLKQIPEQIEALKKEGTEKTNSADTEKIENSIRGLNAVLEGLPNTKQELETRKKALKQEIEKLEASYQSIGNAHLTPALQGNIAGTLGAMLDNRRTQVADDESDDESDDNNEWDS